MPYLICDSCGTLYPISEDEKAYICECGGNLRYYRSLLEYSESVRGPNYTRKVIPLQRTYTENKAYDYRLMEIIGVSMGIIGFIWLISGFLLAILSIFAGIILFMHGRSGGYSWRKGLEGEKTVNKFLEGLPQDYFIFYDVKLPGSKGNIDNVVIGPNGIFVVETKNYTGEYFIKGDSWYKIGSPPTQRLIKIHGSPGKQAKFNAKKLRNFLTEEISTYGPSKPWVHAIVVLVGQKPKTEKTEYYTILQPHEVIDFITKKKGRLTRDFEEESIESVAYYSKQISFYTP